MTERVVRRLRIAWHLSPFLIGLSSLIWIGLGTSLLYTQDSVNYFIQPFAYGNDPLHAATFMYGTNLVQFTVPDLFLDTFSIALLNLHLAPGTVERIGIVSIAVVSNYGYFLLFGEIAKGTSRARNTAKLGGAIVGSLLFLINPYTLTVTWWHFLPWSLFIAGLPFLTLIVILIGRMRFLDPRLYLSLLVLVVLAPGFYGPYASSTLLVFSVFIAAYTLNDLLNGHLNWATVERACVYIFSFAATAWASIAYLITVRSQNLSVYLSGLTEPGQVSALLQSESETTSIANVLRLVGFSWLYQGNGVRSYPWFSLFPLIAAASWLIPLIWIFGTTYLRRYPVLFPIYVTSMIAITFSVGSNPPFGIINQGLAQMGGPFYIVLNAYYFIGEFYVLTVALIAALIFQDVLNSAIPLPRFRSAKIRSRRSLQFQNSSRRVSSVERHRRAILISYSILIAALIVVSSVPFMAGNLYANKGTFVDEFTLPQSFYLLRAYFQHGYRGPLYYVLILPLSQTTGPDLQFENGSFPDSSNLFQNFIPYPVIDHVNSAATIALDNLISSNSYSYISPVLEELHIKYVVMNPFYNSSAWWMSSSPDGGHLNLTILSEKLTTEGAASTQVGAFKVFEIFETKPLAQVFESFPGFASTDYRTYLRTLATINPASNVSSAISNTILVNQSEFTLASVHYLPLSNYTPNVISCNGSTDFYGESDLGDLVPFASNPSNGTCTFGGSKLITSLTNQSDFVTNLRQQFNYYYNPIGKASYISSKAVVNTLGTSRISLKVRVTELSNFNWVNVWVYGAQNNISTAAVFSIYNGSGTCALQSSYFVNGSLAEWTHANLGIPLSGVIGQFNISLSNVTATATFTVANVVTSEEIDLGRVQEPVGGGVNTTMMGLMVPSPFSSYRMNISFINLNATLEDLSILQPSMDRAVFSVPVGVLTTAQFGPSEVDPGTSYTFGPLPRSGIAYYAVLFSPEFPLVSVTGGGTVRKLPLPDYNVFAIEGGASRILTIVMVSTSLVGIAAVNGVVEAVGFLLLATASYIVKSRISKLRQREPSRI